MSLFAKIHDVLVAVDQAAAAALFQTGDDITISSRCGMALLDKAAGTYDPAGPHGIERWALEALATGLDNIEKAHCAGAILNDIGRAGNVLHLLGPYAQAASVMAGAAA